jgi:hypothetical protein
MISLHCVSKPRRVADFRRGSGSRANADEPRNGGGAKWSIVAFALRFALLFALASPSASEAQSLDPFDDCRLVRGREVVNASPSGGPDERLTEPLPPPLPADTPASAACPRVWHLQLHGGGAYYLAANGVEHRGQGYPDLPTAGIFLDASFGFPLHRPRSVTNPKFWRRISLSYRPGLRVQAHYVRLADPPGFSNPDGVDSGYRSLEVLQSRHLLSIQFGRGYQGTVIWSLGGFAGVHLRADSRTEWGNEWRGNPPGENDPVGQLFWVGRSRLTAGVTSELSLALLSLGTVRMGLSVSWDWNLQDQRQMSGTVGPMLQFHPFRKTPPRIEGLGPERVPPSSAITGCPPGAQPTGPGCAAVP